MTLEIVRLGSGVGKRTSADPYCRVVSGKPSARASDSFEDPSGVPNGMRKYYVVFDRQA